MQYCTPEQAGISSVTVLKFLKRLEDKCLSTHSVLMARGNDIFCECYYKPFDQQFKHRMYSVSKSFVSVAIGFCEQDGLISLDDAMIKYFPEYVAGKDPASLPDATIREMLLMETAKEKWSSWFKSGTDDRVRTYFDPFTPKYPHSLHTYDSSGSFMLGVIVERVTGKPFLKYLQEKALDGIGFSKDAYCLQAPGGHSWGDSGVMCTSMDLMRFARFVLTKGTWHVKRYLNEAYLTDATAVSVATGDYGFVNHGNHGYGYQFWGAPCGCFAMLGMGNQIALCDPVHDFIFVITSDNQGNGLSCDLIYDALYDSIIPALGAPLPEDREAREALQSFCDGRELFYLPGAANNDFSHTVSGKTFICELNSMGIKRFRLDFDGDQGCLCYENEQGEKSLPFGFGRNVFGKFPQEGYSDLIGTVSQPGHKYNCACSADWQEPRKLRIRIQIIDKYFGNLAMVFGFRDEKHVSVRMSKTAEAFLEEYQGIMNAKA